MSRALLIDDDVKIRMTSYDSAKYGSVEGKVIRISPDATNDKDSDNIVV